MPHRWSIILVLLCFVVLFLACFFPVLFQDRQFGFRDAAHFYYPLYQRVQQEWEAGRTPLWEIEENAGMPLLGNPTAAVLYPLKVIYAIVPYAWGARLYVVAHTALAYATMLVLMRSWGTSWTGSGLSAMAYAFGAPVLFQSSNIIFLVGAAWLPLGFHAVDQWVRRGRRWALIELAVVLAMQLLGGEPQSAYLLGLAGIGYAAGLAWERSARRRASRGGAPGEKRPTPGWLVAAVILGVVILWIVATLAIAIVAPMWRTHELPPVPLPWMSYVGPAIGAVWGIGGLAFLIYWSTSYRRQRGWRLPLGLAWTGLAGSAALAMAVSGAQLLPVVEFTQRTSRAAEGGTHDIYPFSLEPARLAGLVWPEVLGNTFDGNASWGEMLRPPGGIPHVWVPSLYLGGLTLVLAVVSIALRRGAPWRVWLSVIVLVSALGSLGQYTSPLWAVRAIAEGRRPYNVKESDHNPGPREVTIDLTKIPESLRPLIRQVGPLDSETTTPIRQDDFLRDGDGSLYWLMATFLPAFRQFRYPAKLFTLTCLGLAALAGIGWDALGRGESRRATGFAGGLLALSLILLVAALARRRAIIAMIGTANLTSLYGPADAPGAYAALLGSLVQGTVVLSLGLIAFRLAAVRPGLAGAIVLLVSTADLALANRHYILTVPQTVLETKPEVLRLIEEAERAHPAPGPYRIHRMPSWNPVGWTHASSPERGREIVQWERDTLQPKYGLPLGVEYAHVMGVAELYEYEWYYGGFLRPVRDPGMAQTLGVDLNSKVVYFPRRSFDMWNARYFVVPAWPNGWNDAFRGFASMVLESESVYPSRDAFNGPDGLEQKQEWAEWHDFRILRNRRAHPRAWVVHQFRAIEPTRGLDAGKERQRAMQEIIYQDDPFWSDPTLQAFDPLRVVWIEADQRSELAAYFPGGSPLSSESVKVTYPSPQRVELDVDMKSAGMVVLADIHYPGWELTIDGVPAKIYQANRAMRGAAVQKGPHHLVYTYAPRSYRIGRIVTAAGLVAMMAFSVLCVMRPVERALDNRDEPESPEAES